MKRLLLCLSGLVLGVSGAVGTAAWADPPLVLEGTGARLAPPALVPPFEQNGNTTRFGLAVTARLYGDITSTAPNDESFRCQLLESGRTMCQGEAVFTGTIAGLGEGTTVSVVTAWCDASGACDTRFHIKGVSGDLTELRGTGTSHVTPAGDITYSIRVTRY